MTAALVKAAPNGELTKPPARTPERQALADAIVRMDVASLALTAGRRAVERARDSVVKTEGALEGARGAATEAADQRASELAAAAATGKPAAMNATRKAARTALEDAELEAEAAATALAKLKSNLGDLEDAALNAGNLVVAHVDIVLRTEAGSAALVRAETAALQLRELLPVLRFFLTPQITEETALLPQREMFSTDWDFEARPHQFGRERAARRHYAAANVHRLRDAPFRELGAAIEQFIEQPPHLGNGWYRHPILEAWRAARVALMNDADAPVPPV
jgi:hypothetical protein